MRYFNSSIIVTVVGNIVWVNIELYYNYFDVSVFIVQSFSRISHIYYSYFHTNTCIYILVHESFLCFIGDVNNDDDDHSSKQHLWIVAAVLSFVIAIAGIVAACIIYRYRYEDYDLGVICVINSPI